MTLEQLLACALAAPLLAVVSSAQPGDATRIVLRDARIVLEVDAATGVFTSIEDIPSGIKLAPPDGAAESFRLVLLKPDKGTATILGKDQKLSSHVEETGKLTLRWDGPLKDTTGSSHDIAIRMDVRLNAGSVAFSLHLDNNTTLKVREAWYPLIGGLSQFAADASLWVPTANPYEKPMASPFGTAAFGYPGHMCMSFSCIQSKSAGRSLYFASQDMVARYKVYHFVEQDKNLSACVQHNPYTSPGGTFDGPPVVLKFVEGGWRACGQVYREWFKSAFGITEPSQCWIRRQSFFLMSMFMLPEGTINFRFKDIPKWARAAKACGIEAVQISGWQMGGHDNGYPDYTPDPRLGTVKDLEEGIRACHKMGLKVYFFVNYQPAMVESDWYKRELHKYREMAADGGYTWMAGWGMGTLWARMDHPKLMTWMDLSFPQVRKIIVDQFAKLAEIGGDGVHVDKMFPAAIEYNPDIPMSPDSATWEGAILLTKEVMAACRKLNPDWAMSFECNWDRLLQFTGATWWVGNQPITRQVFPENAETLGLYDAYDYLGVNNAVRGGHIVMVAPMGFSRPLDWAPWRGLGRYIREVKRIRDSLQDTVFYGEVQGHEGADVKAAGDGIDYNVFRNRTTGRHVCVVTNSRLQAGRLTLVGFDGTASAVRIQVPFETDKLVALPATIEVPGERVVFLEEVDEAPAAREASRHRKGTPSNPFNGDFETGDLSGWTADPNWVIADDARQYYSGWQGKYWAWSGGSGEPATGILKSKPFVLDKDAVRLLISGWDSISGTGSPRQWNYVTLNLADGSELDRVYAPNTTAFVPVYLDGTGHKGQKVYVEAVDDADQATYSMLCIDDVQTAALPASLRGPVPAISPSPATAIKLENEQYLLEFSASNGSITRLRDKTGGLDLIREPRLADSFKFALPIAGKEPWQTIEANWVFGREQKLTSHELVGNELTLRWKGPLKNYLGERFDVSATETIELVDGGVLFNLRLDNPSGYPVGETYFPMLGGIQGLGDTRGELRATKLARPVDDSFATAPLFHTFPNLSWLGDHGPEQYFEYPGGLAEPWVGFFSPKVVRSVYVASHAPANRKLVAYLELVPASSGAVREDGNWPRPSELNGQPVGVELSFVDFANVAAGKPYEAAPVFLQFVEGGAREMRKAFETRRRP